MSLELPPVRDSNGPEGLCRRGARLLRFHLAPARVPVICRVANESNSVCADEREDQNRRIGHGGIVTHQGLLSRLADDEQQDQIMKSLPRKSPFAGNAKHHQYKEVNR